MPCSFIAGQLHVFRPPTDLTRVLLALLPLVGALLIAISRCEDYRHDGVFDVTVGSLLGVAVMHFTYRRYYPSLMAPRCDVPFPREDWGPLAKLRDEEALREELGSPGRREGERVPLRDRNRDDEGL